MKKCFYFALIGMVFFYWHVNGMECNHSDCIHYRQNSRKQICLYVDYATDNKYEYVNCMLENEILMERTIESNRAKKRLEQSKKEKEVGGIVCEKK